MAELVSAVAIFIPDLGNFIVPAKIVSVALQGVSGAHEIYEVIAYDRSDT